MKHTPNDPSALATFCRLCGLSIAKDDPSVCPGERQSPRRLTARLSGPPPCAVCGSEEHGHIAVDPYSYACPVQAEIRTGPESQGQLLASAQGVLFAGVDVDKGTIQ